MLSVVLCGFHSGSAVFHEHGPESVASSCAQPQVVPGKIQGRLSQGAQGYCSLPIVILCVAVRGVSSSVFCRKKLYFALFLTLPFCLSWGWVGVAVHGGNSSISIRQPPTRKITAWRARKLVARKAGGDPSEAPY